MVNALLDFNHFCRPILAAVVWHPSGIAPLVLYRRGGSEITLIFAYIYALAPIHCCDSHSGQVIVVWAVLLDFL